MSLSLSARYVGNILCKGICLVACCALFWLISSWIMSRHDEQHGGIVLTLVVSAIPVLFLWGIMNGVINYLFRPRFQHN